MCCSWLQLIHRFVGSRLKQSFKYLMINLCYLHGQNKGKKNKSTSKAAEKAFFFPLCFLMSEIFFLLKRSLFRSSTHTQICEKRQALVLNLFEEKTLQCILRENTSHSVKRVFRSEVVEIIR